MASFDRPYTTSYQSHIVNIALSCTVFGILDIEEYRDFEILVRNHHSVKLRTICIVPKSTDSGLSFCRWQRGSMFIQFYTASSGIKRYLVN